MFVEGLFKLLAKNGKWGLVFKNYQLEVGHKPIGGF
jgi:hypothetical protein